MLSDLEIAQKAEINHIKDIAAKLNISEDDLEYYVFTFIANIEKLYLQLLQEKEKVRQQLVLLTLYQEKERRQLLH